jgi:hypothetical protein
LKATVVLKESVFRQKARAARLSCRSIAVLKEQDASLKTNLGEAQNALDLLILQTKEIEASLVADKAEIQCIQDEAARLTKDEVVLQPDVSRELAMHETCCMQAADIEAQLAEQSDRIFLTVQARKKANLESRSGLASLAEMQAALLRTKKQNDVISVTAIAVGSECQQVETHACSLTSEVSKLSLATKQSLERAERYQIDAVATQQKIDQSLLQVEAVNSSCSALSLEQARKIIDLKALYSSLEFFATSSKQHESRQEEIWKSQQQLNRLLQTVQTCTERALKESDGVNKAVKNLEILASMNQVIQDAKQVCINVIS